MAFCWCSLVENYSNSCQFLCGECSHDFSTRPHIKNMRIRSVPLWRMCIRHHGKARIMYTLSAFWLWSGVVSVLISVTTYMFWDHLELLMSRNFYFAWVHFEACSELAPISFQFCTFAGTARPTLPGIKWLNLTEFDWSWMKLILWISIDPLVTLLIQ